jgi:amino acid transporter
MSVCTAKKKALSVFRLTMINIIAIDSLRNLPTNAANGFLILFYYGIAVVFFLLPCVLITAELATHYPKAGGSYVWVRKAFGAKWALMCIWLLWIYNVVWYPTILSFIGASIAYMINPAWTQNKLFMVTIVMSLFSVATIANCYGMKTSSTISTLSAIFGTLVPILLIIGLGIYWLTTEHTLALSVQTQHFIPKIDQFHNLAFLVIILFSLMGFEMSSIHAEEVKNPRKDYPHALVYSSVVIVVTTILASLAIALVIPTSELSLIGGVNQAFLHFLSAYHLTFLMPVLTSLIILGGFGSMAAWVIGPTRALMIAAEDGLLPKIFARKSKKEAPIFILCTQACIVVILSTLFLLFNSLNLSYWILSDLTAQLALIYYILFFAAALRLRYHRKHTISSDTFTIPGKNWGIWLLGLCGIGISFCALLLGFLTPTSIADPALSHEILLLGGIILFVCPPLLLYQYAKKQNQSNF